MDTREAAKAFVKAHDVREDGGSIFKDNPMFKKSTGKDHPLISKMKPPSEAFFVWDLYFTKLRGNGLSFQEIRAYEEIYGVKLMPWQVDLIYIIHGAVEEFYFEKQQKRAQRAKAKRK